MLKLILQLNIQLEDSINYLQFVQGFIAKRENRNLQFPCEFPCGNSSIIERVARLSASYTFWKTDVTRFGGRGSACGSSLIKNFVDKRSEFNMTQNVTQEILQGY